MVSAFRLSASVTLAALLAATTAAQSPRTLTIDAIYDPDRRVDFSGAPTTNLQWLDDATYLQARRAGGGIEWLKVFKPRIIQANFSWTIWKPAMGRSN